MNHTFTTELGRMRTREQIVRADRYRLAQQVRKSHSTEGRKTSGSRTFAFRRTLAGVGLSALILVAFSSVAGAVPMGPGPDGDGVTSEIVASKHHPQVKGNNPGQPVRSEHAFDSVAQTDPNAEALEARADYYRNLLGLGNEDPNAYALELRAEYYLQRLAASGVSTDAIAQLRALNEPSTSPGIDAVAQLRALNEPSSGAPIDAVAQLRAMNEPFSTTQAPGLEADAQPETDFPLAQSIAVIMGILVLGAVALAVVSRSQHSPKTV